MIGGDKLKPHRDYLCVADFWRASCADTASTVRLMDGHTIIAGMRVGIPNTVTRSSLILGDVSSALAADRVQDIQGNPQKERD